MPRPRPTTPLLRPTSPLAGAVVVGSTALVSIVAAASTTGLRAGQAVAIVIVSAAITFVVALTIAGVIDAHRRAQLAPAQLEPHNHCTTVAVPGDHPDRFYREVEAWRA